jgi:hypothetical protein
VVDIISYELFISSQEEDAFIMAIPSPVLAHASYEHATNNKRNVRRRNIIHHDGRVAAKDGRRVGKRGKRA